MRGSRDQTLRAAGGIWRSRMGGREKGDVAGTTDISRVSPNQYNRERA